MLKLAVRDSQGHIVAIGEGLFEPVTADTIRYEVGRQVAQKRRAEFLESLADKDMKVKPEEVTADFKWEYTGQDHHFLLLVTILIKGKKSGTDSYPAQAENK